MDHSGKRLIADVARVKAARDGCIRSSLDDGTPIGEERHLVRLFPELQNEVGVADTAVWLKALAQVAEIDGAMMLMNLHRIPSAKRDMWTPSSGEMNKVFMPTGAAACAGFVGRNFRSLVAP